MLQKLQLLFVLMAGSMLALGQTSGPPPLNFSAEYNSNAGVMCAWQSPPQGGEWLHYDDGTNVDGVGLDGGGTFWAAIRWEPSQLQNYDDWYLTKFRLFPRKFANNSTFTFKIWEGVNAANLVYEQTLSGLSWNEWNEINMDEVHQVDATTELWIGFMIVNPSAENPMGIDNGSAVAGYGDLVSFDGSAWQTLSSLGLDYNYNMGAYVSAYKSGSLRDDIVLKRQSSQNTKGKLITGNLKPAANPTIKEVKKGLLGFNVYRQGAQVNPNLITQLSFTDPFFTQGTYTYNAKAVYSEGMSEASNSVIVAIDNTTPAISVSPSSLDETHDNPPEITTKTLTLTNSGDGLLIWQMATNTMCFKGNAPKIDPQDYSAMLAERQAKEGKFKSPDGSPAPHNSKAGLCTEGLYTSGCEVGDGLLSWQLENISIPEIPCTGTPAWYHNYTDQTHILPAGNTYVLSVIAGYDNTYLDVWIDFNDDLELSNDELLVDDGLCELDNTTYTFSINIPAGTRKGLHLMRYRTNWNATVNDPCAQYSYGNCSDFIANTDGATNPWFYADITSGSIVSGNSQNITVSFNSADLDEGVYNGAFNILSNDPAHPMVEVPVSLTIDQTLPLVADFSATPLSGEVPLTVTFTDLSSGEITLWEWDFDNNGTVDSNDPNPTFTYTDAGIYSVKLTISDGAKGQAIELKENYITVSPGVGHFEKVWTSPYNPMTFYILEADIDEMPLQAGDEVGLFDVDPMGGSEICVGAAVLIEALTGEIYLEMIASMDDGSNPAQANGFTPGNEILYKLWNAGVGEISTVGAIYPYPGYDEIYASQGSAFVELDGLTVITQCIGLATGWNIMSFRVMPDNPDILAMVQPLIDDDKLDKVLNETGGSVFHLPFPPPNGQWSNTIGDMQATEGYYIKVSDNGMLCATGMPAETPLGIPLNSGWNIIGYPCEYTQNALDAVQPLIDAGVLEKVIDKTGGSIFHLPFPPPNGQWSNTIGDFQSGEGYYLKVNESSNLTIQCTDMPMDARTVIQQDIPTVYFKPVFDNNPYFPMHIALYPCDELQAGDEIAVYDGNICVGATVISDDTEKPIIIKASRQEPDLKSINGYTEGNTIQLMVWKHQSGEVLQAGYEYLEGSQRFAPLETLTGKLKAYENEDNDPNTGTVNFKVMPNPFAQKTNVTVFLKEEARVGMYIQNVKGEIMKTTGEIVLGTGQHNLDLDMQELNSGIYFLTIQIVGESETTQHIQKLIKL